MTEQNRPDQPDAGPPQQPQPSQPGQPLEDAAGQPRYGVRLTPEQLAQHQAQQPAPGAQPGYPAPAYGQPGQSGPSPYGQPVGPQQPYGYPVPGQQQMGPVQKPKEIDRSYWLILTAGLAFLIVELLAAFAPNMGLTPEMIDALESQFQAAGMTVDVNELMESMRVMAIVFMVLIAGLYWLIATGIRKGSNVARIFGTIFAAMSLLSAFGPGFIYVALGVVGIVFAYLRPSNEYFRGKAWEKALRR